MNGWLAFAASLGAAASAWRASPAAVPSGALRRRLASGLAASFALLAAVQWIEAQGWLAGLCATCVSIGVSCCAMPFAVEAVRRLPIRRMGGDKCRCAS